MEQQPSVASCVWLLVVKGNLRHRIVKLGCERPEEELSDAQRQLRAVAERQKFGCTPPERPLEANGAFLYLEPSHAKVMIDLIQEYALKLQSKHMLVSASCFELVERTLREGPEGSGREAFLMRRAGSIEKKEKMPSIIEGPVVLLRGKGTEISDRLARTWQPESDEESKLMQDAYYDLQIRSNPQACDQMREVEADGVHIFLEERAHADYARSALDLHRSALRLSKEDVLVSCKLRCLFERAIGLIAEKGGASGEVFLAERAQVIDSEVDLRDIIGSPNKNFLMIQLDDTILEEKDLDEELAQYLTLPPSAQGLDAEMWRNAWQHVCGENTWLEMKDSGDDNGQCVWCTLCLKWADLPHIKSDGCRGRRASKEFYMGPLLDAILQADTAKSKSQSTDGYSENVKIS